MAIVVTVVMAVDRRPGNLIADEDDEGLEKVGEPTLRRGSRPELPRQLREQEEEHGRQRDLQDHELGDPEARLDREQTLERRERLRDKDLPVHRPVVIGERGVRMGVPQPLRNLFHLHPALPPQRLGDLEEVAVLEVVDRVVASHRDLTSSRKGKREEASVRVRKIGECGAT
ncbi:MAG: hypothetical protein FJ284_10050 [Planctomycetes bacterium]|nr:hypothetical protein [Planctomycetota bacterium]